MAEASTSHPARRGVAVVGRSTTQGFIGTGTQSSQAPSSWRASRLVFAVHREANCQRPGENAKFCWIGCSRRRSWRKDCRIRRFCGPTPTRSPSHRLSSRDSPYIPFKRWRWSELISQMRAQVASLQAERPRARPTQSARRKPEL